MTEFIDIAVEQYGYRMPLRLSDTDVGVVLDADGRIVMEADPDACAPDAIADVIASLMMLSVNAHHGFRIPAGIADAPVTRRKRPRLRR